MMSKMFSKLSCHDRASSIAVVDPVQAVAAAATASIETYGFDAEAVGAAAEFIHDAWMARTPKADYNAAQHVPFSQLPEAEKEKDRAHVRTILDLLKCRTEAAKVPDVFGAKAHEAWRGTVPEGPRMRPAAPGSAELVDINVPWDRLSAQWKKDNYAAGVAALTAVVTVAGQVAMTRVR